MGEWWRAAPDRTEDDLAGCVELARAVHERDRYPRYLPGDLRDFLVMPDPAVRELRLGTGRRGHCHLPHGRLAGRVRLPGPAAARAGAIPVIVAYHLPDRDACGHFSAAWGPTPAGYQTWIDQLAAAIGDSHVIVVVEPDAVPDLLTGCLDPAQQAERYQLLRYAMHRLSGLPRAQVYLDAGNPGMMPDPTALAGPLEQAGIRDGSGFSANVSNFQWTADVVTWAQRLEHALGGRAAAVIDTSRNGRGPYTGPDAPQWCNPPGRALGRRPTLDPGPAGIAAYLWIKDPGVSDGTCNGGPPAGDYWPRYALSLAQQALAGARAGRRPALSWVSSGPRRKTK